MGLLNKSASHDAEGLLAGPVGRALDSMLKVALDGRGPLVPVRTAAERTLAKARSVEAAVGRTQRDALLGAAVGGFVTSLGGFAAMSISLPLNVVEFYVQATRAVGKIAELRGYDSDDADVRTAVLFTLSGAQADDVLAKVGMSAGGGVLVGVLEDQLPESAMMIVNKAVAFRLIRSMGERSLARLSKGVPLIGAFVGAGVDVYMMCRVLDAAKDEFPAA